jgi:peptide deformylase
MKNVLMIRKVGDPILREKCMDITSKTFNSSRIKKCIENLKDTFEYNEGFGIAAPQIGEVLNIIVIKVEKDKCKYDGAEDFPLTVIINPKIEYIGEEKNCEYEGCMSVPEIKGNVERYSNIKVTYKDEKFETVTRTFNNFIARLIQHETDHLNGIIFMDKLTSPQEISTSFNLTKFIKK